MEFEQKLHQTFNDKKELIDMGINTYLIECVKSNDEYLGWYVTVHVDLLTSLNKKINIFLSSWDAYEKAKDNDKMEIILEEVDRFCNDNLFFIGMELPLFKYILKIYDLEEIFFKTDIDLNYYDCYFSEVFENIAPLDVKGLNIEYYGKVMRFVKKIEPLCLNGIIPDDYIEEVPKKEKKTGKLLNLKLMN